MNSDRPKGLLTGTSYKYRLFHKKGAERLNIRELFVTLLVLWTNGR